MTVTIKTGPRAGEVHSVVNWTRRWGKVVAFCLAIPGDEEGQWFPVEALEIENRPRIEKCWWQD